MWQKLQNALNYLNVMLTCSFIIRFGCFKGHHVNLKGLADFTYYYTFNLHCLSY